MQRIKTAVIGLGYWGPNIVRNISANMEYELTAICDRDRKRLEKIGMLYPSAKIYDDSAEMLREAKPELVVIATPVASHAALARAALEACAHVLIEKPMTASVREGEELLEAADKLRRHVFVDHTFVFTGAVSVLRDRVQSAKFGSPLYVDSVRINLGLIQPDVDVIWDLAPHDLSILSYVLGKGPVSVRATGSTHNPRKLADVAYLHVEYANELFAHLHLSWLSPVKVRKMFFAGSDQSVIFDDLEAVEKIKVYEAGIVFDTPAEVEARRDVLVSYRRGDMVAPVVAANEALGTEFKHIAGVLRGDEKPKATGQDGLTVVRVLEAANQSLQDGGKLVRIS